MHIENGTLDCSSLVAGALAALYMAGSSPTIQGFADLCAVLFSIAAVMVAIGIYIGEK